MAEILLIDDDDNLRGMLRMALAHGGHTVTEAVDGRDGLLRFKAKVPQLVITDLIMPEKEGLEFMMEVRKSHPAVKFIAMSGANRRGTDYLRVAKYLGAAQVLSKPFTPEVLLSAVEGVLGTSGVAAAH
jgi:DNA-binding response OmpR family regulator